MQAHSTLLGYYLVGQQTRSFLATLLKTKQNADKEVNIYVTNSMLARSLVAQLPKTFKLTLQCSVANIVRGAHNI